MKALLIKLILPLVRLYWRTFRPRTFGVKAVVVRSGNLHEMLLVQHSYGDQSLLNLPGGGFKPKKESAEAALTRELQEELGCVPESLEKLGEYYTETEGKRDTVAIYLAVVKSISPLPNEEIRATQWCSIQAIEKTPNVARVARHGARLYLQRF